MTAGRAGQVFFYFDSIKGRFTLKTNQMLMGVSKRYKTNLECEEYVSRNSQQQKGGAMAFFTWKESFNIGHTLIDRQHRSFMAMLNEYHEAISSGEIGPAGKNLVDELRSYAAMHFRA